MTDLDMPAVPASESADEAAMKDWAEQLVVGEPVDSRGAGVERGELGGGAGLHGAGQVEPDRCGQQIEWRVGERAVYRWSNSIKFQVSAKILGGVSSAPPRPCRVADPALRSNCSGARKPTHLAQTLNSCVGLGTTPPKNQHT